jgi:hypothetical protein
MLRSAAVSLLVFASPLLVAQEKPATIWTFKYRVEIRANVRDSKDERFPLKFKFPPGFLPVGQSTGYEQTVDAGTHAELSVAQIRLDVAYGNWFAAHTQLHAQDKYRRNPTSEDRKFDADELWLRLGPKPEFLERPERTSVFLQMGKFPKMERQPIRLLESYGLAATSFNRFEDVGFMAGGSVGRNFYWRGSATSGNPLYFRDPNALAGDNGIKELLLPNPDPRLKSGFPILYNTETEGYFLKSDHVQYGEGIGYRWQNAAQNAGFDAIVFHYKRSMVNEDRLTGTFYGAELDLLNGPEIPNSTGGVPIHGRRKEEYGARVYTEWRGLTSTVQATKQSVAGLNREGAEVEAGWQFHWSAGPSVGGESLLQGIQPAIRWSAIRNRFKGNGVLYPAPSIWWNWIKLDVGVRIGFAKNVDLTIEHAKHNIVAPVHVKPNETLVTLRWRL